jgi:hypothetical protein
MSTTVNVSAPCGVALFGGNATYQKARREVGTSLAYRARFVPSAAATSASTSSTSPTMIADREYNVVSIVQSAMGQNSMVNVDKATPNEFACTLLSGGGGSGTSANNLFRVNMLTVQRKQETEEDGGGGIPSPTASHIRTFACSEVVQELIRPVAVASDASSAGSSTAAPSPPPTSILKQIETISLYNYDPTADPNTIECIQRTASYVVPSQTDPLQAQLYRFTQGMPVDVRHYRVTYRRDDDGAK